MNNIKKKQQPNVVMVAGMVFMIANKVASMRITHGQLVLARVVQGIQIHQLVVKCNRIVALLLHPATNLISVWPIRVVLY